MSPRPENVSSYRIYGTEDVLDENSQVTKRSRRRASEDEARKARLQAKIKDSLERKLGPMRKVKSD